MSKKRLSKEERLKIIGTPYDRDRALENPRNRLDSVQLELMEVKDGLTVSITSRLIQ